MGHAYEPEANYDTALGRFRNLEFKSSESPKFEITRNKIVHKGVIIHKIFDISILLNLDKNTESQWSNIFAFQKPAYIPEEGKNKGIDVNAIKVYSNGYPESITSLVPAVLLRTNSNSMHICMPFNGKKSCWDSPEMPIDTWFKLNIRQIYDHDNNKYVYQILINNQVKQEVINDNPELFIGINKNYNTQPHKVDSYKGVIGSTYENEFQYKIAAGQYKDFNFKSEFFRPKPPAGFEHGPDAITPGLKGCSAGENLGRIVGGNIAKKGSWPWFVRFSTLPKDPKFVSQNCGGTLLSNTRILARLSILT